MSNHLGQFREKHLNTTVIWCNMVALTTDCWTSLQNLNYLTLTTHFVDSDWKYKKRMIRFTIIPNHKGYTVGRKIEEVIREWRIRNVSTITVDNASSNDVAMTYLKKKIKTMNELMRHVSCFHELLFPHLEFGGFDYVER